MATSDWWIGSYPNLPEQTVTVSTAGTLSGSMYLDDPTGARSLLNTLVGALTTAGATTPAAFLTQGRRVRLTFGATTSVTWTTTLLRDLLGFTGNLSGASAYTATNISPLFFSPGGASMPQHDILAGSGETVSDTIVRETPALVTATTVNEWRRNRLVVPFVAIDRYRSASEANGEYLSWWDYVLRHRRPFKRYTGITETDGSTTQVTLSGALGPYVLAEEQRSPGFTRSTGFEKNDHKGAIDIPIRTVTDF